MSRSSKAEKQKAATGSPRHAPATPAPATDVSSQPQPSLALRAFFVSLASDLDMYSRFVASPRAVAEASNLSPDEIALLFSGDQGRIYAALRPDLIPKTPPQPAPAAQPAPAPTPQPIPYPYGMQNPYAQPSPYGYPSPYGMQNPYASNPYVPDPYGMQNPYAPQSPYGYPYPGTQNK